MKRNFLIISVLVFVISFLERSLLNSIRHFLDEQVYIEVGLKYLKGTPPYLFNYEHPPLAKYIIDLFAIRNAHALLFVIAVTLTISLIVCMAYYF